MGFLLDKAYETQIAKLYEVFFDSVVQAQDKEKEMSAAGEIQKRYRSLDEGPC